LGRAENAVVENLPGKLAIKHGQESFILGQEDVPAPGAKERQVTDASASAIAANIVPRACTCMAGFRGRQYQHGKYGDRD
jgi:hypothetical protein